MASSVRDFASWYFVVSFKFMGILLSNVLGVPAPVT
nr:MAG TPA: hypothetical protein [Caudoviricetes sp.]